MENTASLPLNMETLGAYIARRCETDADFSSSFRAAPRDCLAKMAGINLPEELQIVLHENDENSWHIPINDEEIPNQALTDQQLQDVSAGEGLLVSQVIFGAVVGAVLAGTLTTVIGGVAVGITAGATKIK